MYHIPGHDMTLVSEDGKIIRESHQVDEKMDNDR